MTDPTPEDEAGVTVEAVKAWLRVRDEVDDDLLREVVAATNVWVNGLPVVTSAPAATPWPADVKLGATMLAARLYRRRNTPSGVESFTDQVVYLPRRDADVDMLLHIGFHATPVVG